MFKKKNCKREKQKVSDKDLFCTSCENKLEKNIEKDWGLVGKNEYVKNYDFQKPFFKGGFTGKITPDGIKIRSNMHILLIGEPGLAKSRILQYVKDLATKGIYVSGKSSSAAGLTATAEKDDFGDGGWTLQAGALVLAAG